MPDGRSTDDSSAREAAVYIAALSGDLATIARSHGFDTLGYLLDMAQMEADNITRGQSGGHKS